MYFNKSNDLLQIPSYAINSIYHIHNHLIAFLIMA